MNEQEIIDTLRAIRTAMLDAWQALVDAVRAWTRTIRHLFRDVRRAMGIRKPTIMTQKIRRHVRSL